MYKEFKIVGNETDYKQILDKLVALTNDLDVISHIKNPEKAINEFDKVENFYKTQNEFLKNFIILQNPDKKAQDSIEKVIADVGFKISMLDDEFDRRGWRIFNKRVSLSYSGSYVSIRKAQSSDAEILTKWWNDGAIMAHAGFPNGVGTTVETVREGIINRSFYNLLFIIEYKREPIGELSANIKDGIASFGIKICNEKYQNNGIGTFVMKKFFKELFSSSIVNKISITTNIKNSRAIHVYRDKLKAVEVKQFDFVDANGDKQKSIEFELTKSQWEELTKKE